jgi:integrase
MYADGLGLYLQIGPTGAKSWTFRYRRKGRTHDVGLGPVHTVSLAEARGKALACRQQLLAGLDPLTEKRRAQQRDVEDITFEAAAKRYIAGKRAEWKGSRSEAQWAASLKTYAYPVFGRMPVREIDTGHVMRVLDPIWIDKSVTAGRVRQRIENILDWAKTRGYRSGENPARWDDYLKHALARPAKVHTVTSHAALPAAEIPGFLEDLKTRNTISAAALEFLILTATRTGEVIGARWDEIDRQERVWVVPAARMKSTLDKAREHRVPLSPQAIAVLDRMEEVRHSPFVFPGISPGRPLTKNTMRALLGAMGRGNLTIHGFRASFRTWAGENTSFASEIAEAALAHQIGDATERAYRRGDFFNKRRRLMEAWGAFCATPTITQTGQVVDIRGAA